jgi:hypothetical protein
VVDNATPAAAVARMFRLESISLLLLLIPFLMK